MRVLTQAAEPRSLSDPITLSMIIAAALHAAIILGVGFVGFTSVTHVPPSLEVILVQSDGGDTPDDANYLAQVSQDGGGNTDDRSRPTSPFQGTENVDTQGIAPMPMEASSPRVQEQEDETILTQLFSDYSVNTETFSSEDTKQELKLSDYDVDANLEMARLSAELDELLNEYAERPRKEFITARTKEAHAASYMFNWVERVERIGNLNYPEIARARKLSGRLLLTVGINKDGSLANIDLRQSSGIDALDKAAQQIVRLAAPFDALSGDLRERTDVLYITRTWEFNSQGALTSND